MSNDITAQQSAYRLPTYGQPIDWSFIRTKEQYLSFVADYKKVYADLSDRQRARKLSTRLLDSSLACPGGSVKATTLQAQIVKIPRHTESHWLSATIQTARMKSYAVAPTKAFKCQKGMTTINLQGLDAVNRWLLDLRKYSKIISQNNWVLDHPTTT